MSILIIADDPDFSRTVVSRWQTERIVPAFTVVSATVWRGTAQDVALAVLGPEPLTRLLPVLESLDRSATTTLCVVSDSAAAQTVRDRFPRVLVLRRHEGWPDALVLIGTEVLRRVEANARALSAEDAAAGAQCHATLGRYMLEMRHTLNNALTSVLGNAELLLIEPGALSAEVREQIDTIHAMAIRMHEVLQRFSSLDTELQFTQKRSHSETSRRRKPARTVAETQSART